MSVAHLSQVPSNFSPNFDNSVSNTLSVLQPSNQLVLGAPGHLTTISSVAPAAAAQTYTLRDAGANANIMLSTNGQSQIGVYNTVAGSATVNTSLTAAQSGSLVLMPQATANVGIVLPAVAVGLWYRILFQAVADGTHTQTLSITGSPASLSGQVMNIAAAAFTSALLPASTIVRSATAANTKIGDYIDVYCDGVTYHCHGVGYGAAATYTVT